MLTGCGKRLFMGVMFTSGMVAGRAATTIDFEGLASFTAATTQYPGASFTNAIVLTAGISLNVSEFPPHSGANVVYDNGGPIAITFASPITSFSAFFTYLAPITLQVCDAGGCFATVSSGSATSNRGISGDPGTSPNLKLQIAGGSRPITRVVITGVAGGTSFTMDDISYETGTAQNLTPSVASLIPVVSSGASQSYSVQFSDPDGWQDLGVVNVLINNTLDSRHGCYLGYSRQDDVLYLVNDNGDGLLPGLALNGSGAVSNSQCTVNGSGSTASGSGNTLMLTLNLSFSSGFGGNKLLYLAARDSLQNNSGWQTMGVHGVPPVSATFPLAVGVNPSSGASSTAMLSFTYQDQSDANSLQTTWALINNVLDGVGACYMAYYRPGNQLFLLPDNGDGSQATSMVLNGASASLSNSQCMIIGPGSSASVNGNQLKVTLNTVFKPAFSGRKAVWLGAVTLTGQSSSWQSLGAWAVPRN